MSPRALFIVSTDGQGHLTRCRALAAELAERGWGASLVDSFDGSTASYDVVIVDDYKTPMERYARFDIPKVAIVDHETADYPVDILVNGCAGAKPTMYSRTKMVLAGPEFALLREPFRQFKWDPQGDTPFDVRRVVNLQAKDVAQRMARAPVVIARAGMRAMEAACIGAPIVLAYEGHAHEENQALNARGLIRSGAAVESPDALVGTMASMLMREGQRAAAMSAAGRKLVDGRGVKRVADAIAELVG